MWDKSALKMVTSFLHYQKSNCFWNRSHVAQAGFSLTMYSRMTLILIPLLLPPKCCDLRHVSPCLAKPLFLFLRSYLLKHIIPNSLPQYIIWPSNASSWLYYLLVSSATCAIFPGCLTVLLCSHQSLLSQQTLTHTSIYSNRILFLLISKDIRIN